MAEKGGKRDPSKTFFNRIFGTELFSSDPKLLNKPILFPHHEKQFRVASWVITAGVGIYLTLFCNFGEEEHILSGFRRFVFGHAKSVGDKFISLDSEEERNIQQKLEKIKTEEHRSS